MLLRGWRAPVPALTALAVTLLVPATPLYAMPVPADALAPPPVAAAAPTLATADAAKQAWIDAARRAEAYHEHVLTAEAAVAAARATADQRVAELAAAEAATTGQAQQVAEADAVVATFRAELDTFANASFRGARLSELSVLLTAASPEDYLDQATDLSRIAEEQQRTLRGALDARAAADTARAAAADQQRVAAAAAAGAAQAIADAERARADLETGRAQLDAEIASYQLAYRAAVRRRPGGRGVRGGGRQRIGRRGGPARRAGRAAQSRRTARRPRHPPPPDRSFRVWAARRRPAWRPGSRLPPRSAGRGCRTSGRPKGRTSSTAPSLMQWSWRQAGVEIPRNSAAQAGLREVPLAELQPGDLVTFYSPVSHVGMYVGDGLVLHASMPGVPIKVVPLDAAGPNATGHAVNR